MNPATACAEVLVDELVRHGVREAVLCPGSRSAPLAFALHAADAAGRLRLHVRTDERAAAFLALGLAKATGYPVPVVTTSGTAVANLHPAVLEASHAGVPLLLLTCDRPPELRGTGANQTTRQVGLFGPALRLEHDLAVPDERGGQVPYWRSTASRAVAAARGCGAAPPGPVQLNLGLREPLVPDGEPTAEPLDGRPDGAPWTRTASPRVMADPIEDDGRPTLVLVGDLPLAGPDWGASAAELAARHGWPLISEPSGGGATRAAVPHGALLLGAHDWLDAHRPQRVLAVGRPTLTRSVQRLLGHQATDVELVVPPGPWPDPASRASHVHPLAAITSALGRATSSPDTPEQGSPWSRAWRSAGTVIVPVVASVLAGSWPSGPAVARTVLSSIGPDGLLFVGSSNPVRDLELAAGPAQLQAGPRVAANRGLAGIDGCLSTAIGLALAAGRPTYALLGDLSFLHDLGGLVVGPTEPRPDLTVIVVNDDGGGIFGTLEPGAPQHAGAFERVFATPHGTDLAGFCSGAGVGHVVVESAPELAGQVRPAPAGLRVVEVRYDRGAARPLRARLADAVASALAG